MLGVAGGQELPLLIRNCHSRAGALGLIEKERSRIAVELPLIVAEWLRIDDESTLIDDEPPLVAVELSRIGNESVLIAVESMCIVTECSLIDVE